MRKEKEKTLGKIVAGWSGKEYISLKGMENQTWTTLQVVSMSWQPTSQHIYFRNKKILDIAIF